MAERLRPPSQHQLHTAVAQKCSAFDDPEGHHRAVMEDIRAVVVELRAEIDDEDAQRHAVRDFLWWCFDYFNGVYLAITERQRAGVQE